MCRLANIRTVVSFILRTFVFPSPYLNVARFRAVPLVRLRVRSFVVHELSGSAGVAVSKAAGEAGRRLGTFVPKSR